MQATRLICDWAREESMKRRVSSLPWLPSSSIWKTENINKWLVKLVQAHHTDIFNLKTRFVYPANQPFSLWIDSLLVGLFLLKGRKVKNRNATAKVFGAQWTLPIYVCRGTKRSSHHPASKRQQMNHKIQTCQAKKKKRNWRRSVSSPLLSKPKWLTRCPNWKHTHMNSFSDIQVGGQKQVQANSQIDNQYGEPADEKPFPYILTCWWWWYNKAVKKPKGVERIHKIWLKWELKE